MMMARILIGGICAIAAGMLLGVPIGFGVTSHANPLWGAPTAMLLLAGMAVVVWMFFLPR
jgi:hypothetical protein